MPVAAGRPLLPNDQNLRLNINAVNDADHDGADGSVLVVDDLTGAVAFMNEVNATQRTECVVCGSDPDDHVNGGGRRGRIGLLPVSFFDAEVTWMLTNCSSVRVVKSAMVIEDRFALLVAVATRPGASHRPAITAAIVIRSNVALANKLVRSHPELFRTDVFVALFPPRVQAIFHKTWAEIAWFNRP